MATADYDHVRSIAIGPWGLNDTANRVHDLAQDVVDSLDRIMTTLNALVLNDWLGQSQQEADDFNSRWNTVMGEIFGSKDKPNDGVLNAVADGVATAVYNYDKAEFGLLEVWNQFAGNLGDPNHDPNDTPPPLKDTPPDVMDPNKTAITADYPPYN